MVAVLKSWPCVARFGLIATRVATYVSGAFVTCFLCPSSAASSEFCSAGRTKHQRDGQLPVSSRDLAKNKDQSWILFVCPHAVLHSVYLKSQEDV